MFRMKKTITVSLETWKELTVIKVEQNFETLDATIRELIKLWKERKQSK